MRPRGRIAATCRPRRGRRREVDRRMIARIVRQMPIEFRTRHRDLRRAVSTCVRTLCRIPVHRQDMNTHTRGDLHRIETEAAAARSGHPPQQFSIMPLRSDLLSWFLQSCHQPVAENLNLLARGRFTAAH